MLRVAMLALGASLSAGALAPQEAAAQLNGRERAEAARRGDVVIRQGDRRDIRIDGRRDERCYDDDRYDERRRKLEEQYRRDRERLDARYRDRLRRLEGQRDRRSRDEHSRLEREWRNERDRFDRARRDFRDRDRDDDDRWDDCDDDDDRRFGSRSGPPFCRNGQGHPVHGMAWCRQKGWEGASLRNTGWGDVILRRPRYGAQSDLGRNILLDVLGSKVLGRFDQQRLRLGASSGLTGRWLDTSNGSVLNLFAGGLQVAQILDRNRDGRADVVLMNYGR
ncbi:MAG: hypothetical protein ACT4O1_03430 [Gemmatimonadota bacterium]